MQENQIAGLGRKHDHVLSFVFSIMLTSAFYAAPPQGIATAAAGPDLSRIMTTIQAAGWAATTLPQGTASITTPSAVAANNAGIVDSHPLTEAQARKIVDYIGQGSDRPEFDKKASDLLKITKGNQKLALPFCKMDDSHGNAHAFYPLDQNEGYLLVRKTQKGWAAFYANSHLNLLGAVYDPADLSGMSAVSIPEAQKSFNSELVMWGYTVDHLIITSQKLVASAAP